MRYTVAVIGPGRAGTAVALGLRRAGHRVATVAGGSDTSRARFVTRFAGVRQHAAPADAVATCDLVLVATPDGAIEEVVTGLAASGAVTEGHHVVHLSGALGLAPLQRAALAGAHVAACHPAQTLPQDVTPDSLVGAAWAVTAAPADRAWAHDLVRDLGGDPHELDDADRVLYHAALAVGSNAVAAATSLARQLLLAARVDAPAAFLRPLVHRSVDNVLEAGARAITGPIVRGDTQTVTAHLAALEADLPAQASAYVHLARAIVAQVRPILDDQTLTALTELLDASEEPS